MSAAAPGPAAAPRRALGPLGLARLLIRFRLLYLWNGVRARGRGRFPTVVVVVGLFTSLAYVGLFSQAFSVIVDNTDVAGQITALSVVALTIAFGSYAAKAASSEAILAGSPENEFLLVRPLSLPTLVIARCLSEAATDPLGALFLFPVLLAAALTWRLPGPLVALAVVVSMVVQVSVSALAQATQIGVVRFVPRARRRAAWMALRLVASLSLAALWLMGTRVLRAPAELAHALAPLGRTVSLTPGALIVGPFAARLRGGSVLAALAALVAVAGGAMLLAAAVARRAGMRGWEEAGASWADAGARPPRARTRPLTAATKDLVLITRDRAQLLTLLAMPVIFVGLQLFGAVGWQWSTANLERVSHLVFSLSLYMATIGPLAHMQAERRAFWILRTVPVSMGRLLASKARAWSVLVGGAALVAFAGFSLGAPAFTWGQWLGDALIVVVGAVGMTWLAIALASSAADLSDEQRPAIGPATIYLFLLVGSLYNVVLAGDARTRVSGFILYGFAIAAYWLAGVQQASVCLDPEETRVRRLTMAHGATLVIVLALGRRAATFAVQLIGDASGLALPVAQVSVTVAVGLATALYLARRAGPERQMALAPAGGLAVMLGGTAAVATHALGLRSPPLAQVFREAPLALASVLAVALVEELLFRGLVQRAVTDALRLHVPPGRRWRVIAAAGAAGASVALALVATPGGFGVPLGVLLVMHGAAAATQAATGRLSAACVARLALLLALASPVS